MTDWRRPDDYPDPAAASLHRWAWEFLCRNPAFEAAMRPAMTLQAALKAKGELPASWSEQPIGVVLRRWGIAFPILPAWRRRLRDDAPSRFAAAPYRHSAPANPGRVTLTFDVSAPIDPQLERARAMLMATQRQQFPAFKRCRIQPEMLAQYLRVLDAQAAGATRRQMLDAFSTTDADVVDERKLRYWIKRANELRDGAYRDLLQQ